MKEKLCQYRLVDQRNVIMKCSLYTMLHFLLRCFVPIPCAAVNCGNSGFLTFRFRTGMIVRTRNCEWVRLNPSFCNTTNLRTRTKIGFLCAKECPLVSGCFPSMSPTPQELDPVPPGPYISVEASSQLVQIPRPPVPSLLNQVSNCPHTASGLKRWHDPSTWGGSIPKNGGNVVIPSQSKVLIDQTVVEVLGLVTIPSGSELIIGSNSKGISISVTGFSVAGRLIAGSETCRIRTPITITLRGKRPSNISISPAPPTYKGINVSGRLFLHGKQYYHTWTRLAKSVEVGDRIILLQEPVNWEQGQQIVLVTSSIKDSRDYNQNEILTIRAVDSSPSIGVGSIVYVKEAVKFRHIANEYYQVEVGLLSRIIKIQGAADDSEPTDPDPMNCVDSLSSEDYSIYYKTSQPCMNKRLTGFGGHVRVEGKGIGQIQGVEFFRMGQTNVKGRYPMHFHLLGNCPSCYVKDSSFHRSFYRCVAVHGTNDATVSENVAFDVVGFCYYLEDGVEERNILSYNLAAHVHTLGPNLPRGSGDTTDIYVETSKLILPADVTASGFYITNVRNYIIGNSASGGWAGFAFPILPTGLQTFNQSGYRPLLQEGLTIDGNTAHSTGWWWYNAGAFYFGGELYYNNDGLLEYNPGRGDTFFRNPCSVDPCLEPYSYCNGCPETAQAWLRITNTKTFLTAGVGLNSWSGRLEVIGYESHDSGLSLEILSDGFWLDNALTVCRTGESLRLPSSNAYSLLGSGFLFYDIDQKFIFTRATFRNCGYRADEFNQYDNSPTRGCGYDDQKGCRGDSTTLGFVTFSDQFTPQVMQGTKEISFDNCGRRFKFTTEQKDTVSGRAQNLVDVDGSVSGLGEPAIIGSGLENAKNWWAVDNDVYYDLQGPLIFTKVGGGPQRNIGYVRIEWDKSLHDQVGSTLCKSVDDVPCPAEGFVRHAGKKFSPFANPAVNNGLPLTARGDVVGPTGGFGWIINFIEGAPRSIVLKGAEIYPNSPMIISIPYPPGTTFKITAQSVAWCKDDDIYKCNSTFVKVSNVDLVRNGAGNAYHVSSTGILTFRMAQTAMQYTGNPTFSLPTLSTPPRQPEVDLYSLYRFERDGIVLPRMHRDDQLYSIQAKCPGDTSSSPKTGYCPEAVSSNYDPDVCPSANYVQVAYDKCCQKSAPSKCIFADGSKNF